MRKWVPTVLQVKPHSDALLRRLQLHVGSSFDTRLQRPQLQPTLRGGHVLRKGGAAVAALPVCVVLEALAVCVTRLRQPLVARDGVGEARSALVHGPAVVRDYSVY